MKTGMTEYSALQQVKTKEYSVSIEGVIEVEEFTELKAFFDGLLDVIIEYVEQHNAMAGLSMAYEQYIEVDELGDSNDEEGA
jgi:hypothetical protein